MPVTLQRTGRVATVVLDKAPLNILDLDLIDRLDQVLAALSYEDDLQLVVLRGAGKGFSAGVSVQDHSADKVDDMLDGFHGAVRKLRSLPAVTLAAVHGACLGGGCELATACDLVLATDETRFGLPEIRLGCFPPVAATLYPRRLGPGRTLDLLLTGREFSASEAEELGLVTWRCAATDLDLRLQEKIAELTTFSAPVSRLIKQAVRAGMSRPFDEALVEAEELYRRKLVPLDDMREGLDAFLEKREPEWTHR